MLAVYQSDSFCGYKIHACIYGQSEYHSMAETIVDFKSSRSKLSQSPQPKLTTLPPTNEAFEEIVANHLQVAFWRHALEPDLPSLQPTSYGWGNSLMPTTVPEGTLFAPVQLLQLIRCSCESDMPCIKTKTKNIF